MTMLNMAFFQEIRVKRFAVAPVVLAALLLLVSILFLSANAHSADVSVQQVSVHQGMNAGMAADTHGNGMDCCVVACEWRDGQLAFITTPTIISTVNWVPVTSVPTHTFFGPLRRPPRSISQRT